MGNSRYSDVPQMIAGHGFLLGNARDYTALPKILLYQRDPYIHRNDALIPRLLTIVHIEVPNNPKP